MRKHFSGMRTTRLPPYVFSMWTEFLTHTCEKITFSRISLGTVKTNVVNIKFGITKIEKIIEVKKLRSVGTVDGIKYFNFNQLKSNSNLNLK